MSLKSKMLRCVEPHLKPGEAVEQIFPAQTRSPYLLAFGFIVYMLLNRYRVVAVTNMRIFAVDSGMWTSTRPGGPVVAELARAHEFGSLGGIFARISLADESLLVHRRYFGLIRSADASRPGSSDEVSAVSHT